MAADKKKILKNIGWALVSLVLIGIIVFFARGSVVLGPSIEPDQDMSPSEKVADIMEVGQEACTTAFTVAPPAEPTLSCTAKRVWDSTKTNQITEVNPGDIIVYELAYTSSDITSFTVTDTLDSNVSFLDSASGCTHSSGTVSCSINTSSNPNGSLTFRVQVDSDLAATTTISNTATVRNTTEGLSDTCSVDVKYTHVDPGNPTLSCTKKNAWTDTTASTAVSDVDPGDTFVYEIEYTSSEISSFSVTDVLNDNLSYVSSPDGCTYSSATRTVSCNVNTSVASSGSVMFSVKVDSDLTKTTTISNTATLKNVAENLSDTCSKSVTYTYEPGPSGADLSCTTKRIYTDDDRNTSGFYYLENELISTSGVKVGDKLVYNIAVENKGDEAVSNVLITDKLPSAVSYVDSDSECSYNATTSTVSCDIGTLAVGGKDSSSIRVSVASAGSVANTADITASNGQTDSCSITVDATGTSNPPASATPTPVAQASPTPSALPEAGIMTLTAGSIGAGVLLLILGFFGLLLL